MAVRIRMKRFGRTHRPFYRICVMDSRNKRDGRAIEEVGFYDTSVPDKSKRVKLDLERIDYWMGVGAKPSDKVAVLIKKVKTDSFGSAGAPAPMAKPKDKVAEAEAAVKEAAEKEAAEKAESEKAESAEADSSEAAEESKSEAGTAE